MFFSYPQLLEWQTVYSVAIIIHYYIIIIIIHYYNTLLYNCYYNTLLYNYYYNSVVIIIYYSSTNYSKHQSLISDSDSYLKQCCNTRSRLWYVWVVMMMMMMMVAAMMTISDSLLLIIICAWFSRLLTLPPFTDSSSWAIFGPDVILDARLGVHFFFFWNFDNFQFNK